MKKKLTKKFAPHICLGIVLLGLFPYRSFFWYNFGLFYHLGERIEQSENRTDIERD